MVNWTPELISKFLLTTLQQISPQISGETWKKVADIMGDDISAEACRQKYAKLLGAAGIEPAAATSSAPATPATPKSSRKRKDVAGNDATPSKTASVKKQKKAQPAASLKVEEDEGQAEELVPPTPFVKKFASADESD